MLGERFNQSFTGTYLIWCHGKSLRESPSHYLPELVSTTTIHRHRKHIKDVFLLIPRKFTIFVLSFES
jgi:hypothetical protein